MKKILLVFSLFIFSLQLSAQNIRVGLKGGGNTTWLINTNVFDADQEIDHDATFGATIGASGTIMFNKFLGVSLDIMYASVNQNYNGEFNNSAILYKIKEKLRYIELPLFLKLASDKGPYFEIGPKLSLLTSHKEEMNFEDPYQFFGTNGKYKKDFNSTVLSVALGFGVDIKVANNMYVTAGLRMSYNPGDAMKKQTQAELESPLENHSLISMYSSYDNGDISGNDRVYRYQKTHLASAGLIIGYTYRFGKE